MVIGPTGAGTGVIEPATSRKTHNRNRPQAALAVSSMR